jgi:serine protease AprX
MRNTLLCTLLLSSLSVVAQTGPDLHWVRFTDKDNTPYSLDAPEEYLSPRALTRRAAQNIALDEQDLPVDPAYIAAVLATGEVQLVNRSKWFNAITVRTSDPSALETIAALPFVAALRSVTTTTTASPNTDKFRTPHALAEERGGASDVYGRSFRQIEMLNGHTLHALNAEGQGMLIGVLDSGFERCERDRCVRGPADPGGDPRYSGSG